MTVFVQEIEVTVELAVPDADQQLITLVWPPSEDEEQHPNWPPNS